MRVFNVFRDFGLAICLCVSHVTIFKIIIKDFDGRIDPSLVVVPTGLGCMFCRFVIGAITILVCN